MLLSPRHASRVPRAEPGDRKIGASPRPAWRYRQFRMGVG